MQPATVARPEPGRFRLFRGEHFAIELVILAAVVLTVLAFYFRDPLTRRELTFTPDGDGQTFLSYQFNDSDMGGNSLVAAEEGRPLAWTCDLRPAYEYR